MLEFREPYVFLDSNAGDCKKEEILNWKIQGFKEIVFLGSQASNVEKGILPITELPGLNAASVSQWLLTELLLFARKNRIELMHKTALVIGCGSVGSALKRPLTWLDIDVGGFDKDFPHCSRDWLKDWMEKSDFIFVCLPETSETKGFFKGKESWFKSPHQLFSISRESVLLGYPWPYVSDKKHVAWNTREVMMRKRRVIDEYPAYKGE